MIDKFCKWGKKLLKENWITFKRVDFYLRNFFEGINSGTYSRIRKVIFSWNEF